LARPQRETDEPAEGETAATRRCLVTGDIRPKAALIRFVVSPDGHIVPDIASRLPGRGLWLTARRDIVDRAVVKRLFARAARRPVSAPPGLADRLEALLVQRCIEAVGLARRAGLAVAGFEKVREAVRTGKSALLLAALDGAEGGRSKLAGLAGDLPLAVVLSAAELGIAFGREHVVQAAVGRGPLCGRLAADAKRIAGFRATAEIRCGAAGRQQDSIGSI